MSYTVLGRVYQTNTNTYFHVVEQGVWHYGNGGTWSQQNGTYKLTMGKSGTCGILRFVSESGDEAFLVATGVHNYKPWVDIVTNLSSDYTTAQALPDYYNKSERIQAREAQRTQWEATNNKRRTIKASYRVKDGNSLELDIVVG